LLVFLSLGQLRVGSPQIQAWPRRAKTTKTNKSNKNHIKTNKNQLQANKTNKNYTFT